MNEETQDHDAEEELVKVRELLDLMCVPAPEASVSHRLELLLRSNVWLLRMGEEVNEQQWACTAYVLASIEPTKDEIVALFNDDERYEDDEVRATDLGPLLSYYVFDSNAKD